MAPNNGSMWIPYLLTRSLTDSIPSEEFHSACASAHRPKANLVYEISNNLFINKYGISYLFEASHSFINKGGSRAGAPGARPPV